MIRLLLAASVVAALAAPVPPVTIPYGASHASVDVDLSASRKKLLAALRDRTRDVALDLDGVEAEHNPASFFEVHVHAPGGEIGESVGNLALYGAGIRDETNHPFAPAHFRFVVTDVLRPLLEHGGKVTITFVAKGAVRQGAAVRSSSNITIAKPSFVIERRTRDAN